MVARSSGRIRARRGFELPQVAISPLAVCLTSPAMRYRIRAFRPHP